MRSKLHGEAILWAAILFAVGFSTQLGCSPQSGSSPPPPGNTTSTVGESASSSSSQPGGAAPGAFSPAGSPPGAEDSKPTPVAVESGTATLSPANTTIQFVGTHMPPAKPDPRTGVFTQFSGKINVGKESKMLTSVSVEIKTESLETAFPQLTNHLRSNDFFDARQYPTAKFESTSISSTEGDAKCEIVGNLTLMQATKEIRIPATVTISDEGLLLTGEFMIDRTVFGMSGQDKVSKDVAMKVSVGEKTQVPRGGALGGGGGGSGGRRSGSGPAGTNANPSEGLSVFHQRDTDKNGKLSGDELVGKMKENLSLIDTDGDGAISEEEFKKRQTPAQPGRKGPGSRGGGPPKGKDAATPETPESETPK